MTSSLIQYTRAVLKSQSHPCKKQIVANAPSLKSTLFLVKLNFNSWSNHHCSPQGYCKQWSPGHRLHQGCNLMLDTVFPIHWWDCGGHRICICEKIFLPFQRIPTFQSVSFVCVTFSDFGAVLVKKNMKLLHALGGSSTYARTHTHMVTDGGSVCCSEAAMN